MSYDRGSTVCLIIRDIPINYFEWKRSEKKFLIICR